MGITTISAQNYNKSDVTLVNTTQYSEINSTSVYSPEEEEVIAFFLKMDQLLSASQMHEKSGQLELALGDVELALEFLDQIAQKWEGSFSRYYNHFTLRKGALLLALGNTEKAVEVFLNHPPKDVATVLLYRFIEQKFHVQLLRLTDPVPESSESDYLERARSLFFAGHYDEAERLLEEKTYGVLLRCACLTMLGKVEVARELRQKEILDKPYLEHFDPEYTMLCILQDDLPSRFQWDGTSEWIYRFPLGTFLNYSEKL